MTEKRKINVEENELSLAFEANSLENSYYLNIKDGSIKVISEYESFIGNEEEELDPEEWHMVPLEESWEAYNRMVEFVKTVKDFNLRNKLLKLVNGRGAFRRFKDLLIKFPKERQRFFEYENTEREKRATTWLKELEKEFNLIIELI